jgi:putative serine dehydratase-like protein
MLMRQASSTRRSAGAGSFEFEAASGVYTELQCGSYIFMDADYGRNRDHDGAPTKAFEPSLFVWATVMSRPPEDRAIVDAGLKALAFDSGPPLVCDESAATYERASDEQGRPALSAATNSSGSATRSASSPATATRPSTSTTGMSASAPTASSNCGRSPREVQFIRRALKPCNRHVPRMVRHLTHEPANYRYWVGMPVSLGRNGLCQRCLQPRRNA